jgi:hypothetical protein
LCTAANIDTDPFMIGIGIEVIGAARSRASASIRLRGGVAYTEHKHLVAQVRQQFAVNGLPLHRPIALGSRIPPVRRATWSITASSEYAFAISPAGRAL